MTTSQRHPAVASVALTLIVVACGPAQPDPTASPTGSEPPPNAETMIVGVHVPVENALGDAFGITPTDLPLHSLHPNGSLWDGVVRRFVYSGLYRYDGAQSPVPDLAAAPCAVSEDLLVVTCELQEVTFHDGTALTADDVAFTYQLLISDACRMLTWCATPELAPKENQLAAATALDQRTVEFRLAEPDPAFITAILPEVLIEPKARVELAFAEFVEATDGVDPAQLESAASALEAALPAPEQACEPPGDALLGDAEVAIADVGRALHSRDEYAIGPGGAIEACAYGSYLVRVLTDAADAMQLTGIDAIAAAYRILELPLIPVGTGPWRVMSIDPGVSMQLEAFAAFHRGIPASAQLEVRLIRSAAEAIEAVRTGAIHWLLLPFEGGDNLIADGVGDIPAVVWVEYNEHGYYQVDYNLREGRLFADPNLREAMELCVDKRETVAASTDGDGVPIYSPISPSMWAFEPNLPQPSRDVDAGRALIEASGWTLGDDGIYRMGDQRLAAVVPVVDALPQAIRFLELLAFQVAECGIEIVPQPMSFDELYVALTWPLVAPGADEPWDALFSGWQTGPDPDTSAIYHSSATATPTNPEGFNYIGYASEESDTLLEQARATYDPRERARLYREHQRVFANDRPVLLAFSPLLREPRVVNLESTLGPLDTDTSTWWWQLETLFVRSPEP